MDRPPWPDSVDALATTGFVLLGLLVPVLGYFFMVADFRAYLRSLRRALIVVAGGIADLPGWVRRETPRSVAALGLSLPCTQDDVKQAYRQKVKHLHPDRGGDRKRFMRLQAHFEEALKVVQREEALATAAVRSER